MRCRAEILLAMLLLIIVNVSTAQTRLHIHSSEAVHADSADTEYYGTKHFWRAAATVTGLNIGVWAYDRYVQNAEFARISPRTVSENISQGLIWDNDRLGTNMFLHPYHGNLYYNSARANGFNYWQSGLFAFAGSAMWEVVFESEYPSTNDIIATPVGGMAIGEVFFRASDLLVKDNSTGWERFGREAGIFLLSPMRSLTRIINGDAWRKRETTGRIFGVPHISYEVSLGARLIEFKNRNLDKGMGGAIELDIEYGDRYGSSRQLPYDYFKLRLNLNAQASQPVLGQLNIMGRLLNKNIIEKEENYLSAGLYQHYDYYDSDTISAKSGKAPYRLAVPASVGIGMLYKFDNCRRSSFDAHAHINAIILGGVLSDHYNLKDRDYNLGSGFSCKVGANYIFGRDRFTIQADYEYYRIFTWGYPRGTDLSNVNPRTLNAEGDASAAYFGVLDLRADVKIAKRLWITAACSRYRRSTHYRDFPHVKSTSFEARLMLTFKY